MTDQQAEKNCAIGAMLRTAREKRGMSVRDVARKLKLPSTVVTTIENDQLQQLAPIYRRGYVLNYARLLDIDMDAVCEQLDHDDNRPPELQEVLQIKPGAWRFERYLRVATYVLTTAFIAVPLIMIFVKVAADFFESSDAEARHIASATSTAADEKRVSQRIGRLVQTLEELAGEETPDRQHLSASTMPILGLLSSTPSAGSVTDTNGLGPLRDAQTIDAIPTDPAGPNELVVEIHEACWVEIHDLTGRRMEYDLLGPGRHVYRGTAPFEIMLGKAAGVSISVDGQPANFAHRIRANIARFELAADGSVGS